MLEQPGLLLGPWQPVTGHQQVQPVWDLVSRQPLGFVQQARGCSWLRWLRPECFEVFESEDAALLCRIVQLGRLLWCWEVQDADRQRIALIARRCLFDVRGRPVARIGLPSGHRAGVFWRTPQQTLATFEYVPEGICLKFAAVSPAQPLLRMALLGAVIVYEPRPALDCTGAS